MTRITDEIVAWIEQDSSICLRAVSSSGDPVELNEHEAARLIAVMQRLVLELARLDNEDG